MYVKCRDEEKYRYISRDEFALGKDLIELRKFGHIQSVLQVENKNASKYWTMFIALNFGIAEGHASKCFCINHIFPPFKTELDYKLSPFERDVLPFRLLDPRPPGAPIVGLEALDRRRLVVCPIEGLGPTAEGLVL